MGSIPSFIHVRALAISELAENSMSSVSRMLYGHPVASKAMKLIEKYSISASRTLILQCINYQSQQHVLLIQSRW